MAEEKHYVYGVWTVLHPDTRQYKQQSIEITLDQIVAVEVPAEFIHNSFTTTDGERKIILTPAGVLYVQEQFEKLYEAPVETKAEDWADAPITPAQIAEHKEDGWDETQFLTGKAPEVKKSAPAEDDGWGDEPVFTDNVPSGNTPDTEEKWNEEAEDWK